MEYLIFSSSFLVPIIMWAIFSDSKKPLVKEPPYLYKQVYQGPFKKSFEQLKEDLQRFSQGLNPASRCDIEYYMIISDTYAKEQFRYRGGYNWDNMPTSSVRDSTKFQNVLLQKAINNLEIANSFGAFKFLYERNLNVTLEVKITFKMKRSNIEKDVDEIIARMEVDEEFADELVKRGVFLVKK